MVHRPSRQDGTYMLHSMLTGAATDNIERPRKGDVRP